MPVLSSVIKQFTAFKELPHAVIEQLCLHATLTEAPRRKIIMHKGEVSPSLGLLLEGRLQGVDMTLDGYEAGLYFIEPYDFFAELSVIDSLPAPEYIVALSTVKFITIPNYIIQALVKSSPEMANIMNHRLAQRLRTSISQRSLLAMPTPIQRICSLLISMVQTDNANNAIILDSPTHQELAIMINTTRETVTRSFQKLQKNNIIKRNGTTLMLNNLHYIQSVANNES